ncbi:MAG: hypothetical protein R3F62_23380 [Planctomycetota bacterium]
MGDFTHDVFSHDAPRHPEQGPPRRHVAPRPCAACGSADTVCTFAMGGGSLIGTWSEEEFCCLACGRFTTYVDEYES